MNRQIIVSILCGLLFGAGLVVSGMSDPARVLGFLDVTGLWDPSLAFVMGGALIPSSLAYLIRNRRETPVFEASFQVPDNRRIDRNLVVGAGLFGLGWGLVGLCPGPAFAALVTGRWQIAVFVAAMLAGMVAYRLSPFGSSAGTASRAPVSQQT
ncbi:YeeE/YedE family protein [Rhizobium halophytocola]|uniref:Membrane protein YedE/YeeE n=1 Tax=Rhizobium halophytocola TaxID=735519 RepID=A0ABS4DTZ3_9HYPH|nr:YeeE/YedE family protein [Rhizobium halophytocola]MBP1849156.1 putative membrane protein YedE/YeeE [Rhizobium halophytocola]